jgi:hypothetical protein
MSEKILHYRDHKNGGQFDGDCYIKSKLVFADVNYPVRVRFRLSEFESGFQYIWGIGTGNNQYSLKIVRDTSDYYYRVTYLNVDYDFIDVRLGILSEINMVTVWVDTTTDRIYIKAASSKYGNTIGLDYESNTSDDVTYSIPVLGYTIGATRYISGAETLLDPTGHFTGRIYDFETHYSADGEGQQRLVFYEKYLGSDREVVYDYFENVNGDGDIIDIPSDFWPEETDISAYVQQKTAIDIKYLRDDNLVPEYTSTKFTLFNYFEVSAGDTIAIEINDKITWVLNVTKVKIVGDGHKLDVECEDILSELKEIKPFNYALPKSSYFNTNDRKWWSNYEQDGLECSATTSISLFYLLKQVIYITQYDNIVTVDISNLSGSVDSLYYDYVGSINVTFSKLGFSFGMFIKLNRMKSSDWDDSTRMNDIFREILLITRLLFYVDDGAIVFDQIDSGNVSHSPIWNSEPSEIKTDRRYNSLTTSVCTSWGSTYNASLDVGDWGDEHPDTASYPSFDSKDLVKLEANSLYETLSEWNSKDTVKTTNITPHLWLFIRNATTGEIRLMWNTEDSQSFLYQLAGILDDQLRRDFEMERITISLTENNSPKYQEKIDDLVKRRTEIYQEVAT